MRLATPRIRLIAQGLSRAWRDGGLLGRLTMVVGLGFGVSLLCAAVATFSLAPATVSTGSSLAGIPVPPGQLLAVKSAGHSCPALSPSRLAAQLMTASAFDPDATTAGGSGVAGLSSAQWRRWAPAPGDTRSDVSASITALAHLVCNLAGQVRAAGVRGSPWRLALAAFHSGITAVIARRAIPADAVGYVDTVADYADWYARQSQFSGA
jgi:hypothetical protein